MSKWYEVKIVNIQIAMIEVADDADESMAFSVANDFTSFDGDTECEATLISSIEPHRVDNDIRCADHVVYLHDYD